MNPECFGGVGMFKNFEYEMKVDPQVKPVFHAPRRVPIALQPKLEAALRLDGEERHNFKGRRVYPWTN